MFWSRDGKAAFWGWLQQGPGSLGLVELSRDCTSQGLEGSSGELKAHGIGWRGLVGEWKAVVGV